MGLLHVCFPGFVMSSPLPFFRVFFSMSNNAPYNLEDLLVTIRNEVIESHLLTTISTSRWKTYKNAIYGCDLVNFLVMQVTISAVLEWILCALLVLIVFRII